MDNEAMAEAIGGAVSGTSLVFSLIMLVLMVIAYWKMFEKAGVEGWKSLIPLYNLYILFQLAWGNGLLFLLMLIPCVNIVVGLILDWKICKAYGQGVGIFVLMLFLPNVAWLCLGFSKNVQYIGPQ